LEELLIAFSHFKQPNARLQIRCPEVPGRPEISDSRVSYLSEFVSQREYFDWIQEVHCGIFPFKAEGFGLPELDFAACGKPVIYTGFSSPCEFLPHFKELMIAGDFKPSSGKFEGLGSWVRPSVDSIVKCLEIAFSTGQSLSNVGLAFREQVRYLTWENTATNLQRIFKSERLVN
jgi:glycosyltransferase involved in cell wall biosynthesis